MVFDPATLTGKRLWLRAKDNVGANGSAITTWVDQSGATHDGTAAGTLPTVATAATPLSGKAVQFSGAGNFGFSNVLSLVTASSQLDSTTFAAINVDDAIPSTQWASSTQTVPQWLRFEAGLGSVPVTSYTLETVSVTGALNIPRDWTLDGSNNGTTWTTLDTRTNAALTGSSALNVFSFTNTSSYRYYRLNITATVGADYIQLSRFSLAPRAAEIWAVIKAESTSDNGLWNFNSGATFSNRSLYPYSTYNRASDAFGVRDAYFSTPAGTSLQVWRTYRVINDGTNVTVYLDGVQTATDVVATLVAEWSNSVAIGKTVGAATIIFFTGKIAEVLVRSQVSTAQEVTDITAYLQAEHFVAATVPPRLSHPTMTSRVAVQQASRW